MDNNFGRPNRQMHDQINQMLRRLEDCGRHQAAAGLYRKGVPLPVICRVLDECGRRRPST